jgi:gamma-glutamyltranspeptidase / glutathione hydrolase
MHRGTSLLPALCLFVLVPATACEPAPDTDALRTTYWPEDQIRPEVSGIHGAVTAGHPLAAQAGYEVLRAGGTAADAAVTMAAVLAVVRPHMNGVGGDAFALFYEAGTGRVTALNGSGRAAEGATPELFAAQGIETMPQTGPLAVTVPGAVSAWASTLQRYGTLPMARALAPAIRLADEGFVVTHTLAEDLASAPALNDAGRALYAPGGEPLPAGSILRNPALARTLRTIADQGSAAFYGGAVGQSLARFLEAEGSPLRLADFAAHTADWVEPVSMEFRGKRVHTLPPNSQSVVLLQTLAIAESRGLDGHEGPLDPDLLHTLVEAKKLAFADRDRWVADPGAAPAPLERLLDRDYLAERARRIGPRAAEGAEPGPDGADASGDGDTVYLIAVDAQGNAVSWIQSLFHSFGSGLVEPETGIVLQNRGGGFTLEENHPNRIAPGKRPFHTLMATLLTNPDGSFHMALGTPGGHGQSQTQAQALVQMLVFGMSPQAAVEAPRFRSYDGLSLAVEGRMSEPTIAGLAARGHDLTIAHGWTAPYGNLQVIRREENGVLRTGADMRREGAAAAY